MIKLGTEKELYKISHLPINVQNAISEDVKILDEYTTARTETLMLTWAVLWLYVRKMRS